MLGVLSLVATAQAQALVHVPYFNASFKGNEITAGEAKVHEFMGIPYGRRKSKMSTVFPVIPEGEFDATKPGNICPQTATAEVPKGVEIIKSLFMDFGGAEEHFDCATLDIYRPANAESAHELMEVVVYVHGGSLTAGSRRLPVYIGNNIHRLPEMSNKIFVSIEYSLGPYGFWYESNEKRKIANIAILEIIESLKWVQNYIHAFGGDFTKVTLMGHSAGATLAQYVHFLLDDYRKYGFNMAPFHKIIMMSGTAFLFSPVTPEVARTRQHALLEAVGCSDAIDSLNCLRSKSDKDITDATKRLPGVWGPVLDGFIIDAQPMEYLKGQRFLKDVDVLLTTMKDDASFFTARHREEAIHKKHEIFGELGLSGICESMAHRYCEKNLCPYETTTKIVTNAAFNHPALESAAAYREAKLRAITHVIKTQLSRPDPSTHANFYRLLHTIHKGMGWSMTLDEMLQFVDVLGGFHGLDQVALLNPVMFSVEMLNRAQQSSGFVSQAARSIVSGIMGTFKLPKEVRTSILPDFDRMANLVTAPIMSFINGPHCTSEQCEIEQSCQEGILVSRSLDSMVAYFYCLQNIDDEKAKGKGPAGGNKRTQEPQSSPPAPKKRRFGF